MLRCYTLQPAPLQDWRLALSGVFYVEILKFELFCHLVDIEYHFIAQNSHHIVVILCRDNQCKCKLCFVSLQICQSLHFNMYI